MPQNFFITGIPRSGKTTLMGMLIEELKARKLRIGGIISPDETHHGTRLAFYVMDIRTKKKGLLASVDGDGPKVSKYHVDVTSFETVAMPALSAFDNYDVVIIDEIGAMELKSERFRDMLDQILESPVPLIASLHWDYVMKYGAYGEVVLLQSDNHEQVRMALLSAVNKAITARPRKLVNPAVPVALKLAAKKAVRPAAKKGTEKVAKKTAKPEKKTTKKEPKKALEKETRPEEKKAEAKKGLFSKLKGLFR